MNGVHDVGGMHGFGTVEREVNEPVFHSEWEKHVMGLMASCRRKRTFNLDEFRRTVERMPPARYLQASYYERWLHAIEALLIEKRVLSATEIGARLDVLGGQACEDGPAPITDINTAGAVEPSPRGNSLRRNSVPKPRFKPGERVFSRNLNSQRHTRMPRYVRGHHGVVRRYLGAFVFPDDNAHGLGAVPRPCYAVEFTARELWGAGAQSGDRVCIDLWEDYLAPIRQAEHKAPRATSRLASARRKPKVTTKARGAHR